MSNVVRVEFGNATLNSAPNRPAEPLLLDEICNNFVTQYPHLTDQAYAWLDQASLIEHPVLGGSSSDNRQAFERELQELLTHEVTPTSTPATLGTQAIASVTRLADHRKC